MFALARQEAKNGGWEECRRYAYFSTLFLLGGRCGEIQRLEVDDFNPKFQDDHDSREMDPSRETESLVEPEDARGRPESGPGRHLTDRERARENPANGFR